MNNPKRQHFVPKMLSRQFACENDQVYFFNRRFSENEKCVKKTNLINFCVEKDIYTLCDEYGNKNFSAEEKFAKLEKQAAEIMGKIISSVTAKVRKLPRLTTSEKKTLDWFLLCQWGRVPERTDPMLDRTFRNPQIRLLSKGEQNKLRKEIRVVSLTREILNPNKKILSILGNKGLAIGIIADGGRESFIIGSNPVLEDPPNYYPFGKIRKDWLPISPKVVVAQYFDRGREAFCEFEDEGVRLFNQAVFAQSEAIAGNSKELVRRVAGM